MRRVLFFVFILLCSVTIVNAQDSTITGNITANTVLSASKAYFLDGFVRVQSGATLTIPAGTNIYGKSSSQGTLIIKPGGKIDAQGTVNNPIVFTSEFAKPGSSQAPQRGDWGGIILLGNAPINVPGGTASIEGPGDQFGGSNASDNSGTMKYVRIEYPGIAFSPNNEINGLTFGGIGSGTTIDYIQVSYSNDDSFEWFGGTVNCKHLIAYGGIDDDFDTDFGFSGKLQFLVGLRDPQVADVGSGSNGFESDNDGSGSTNSPRTSPTWWNVTLIGPQIHTNSVFSSDYKRGMHLRRSSQNKINNTIIAGWPIGVLIDGTNTTADAQNGIMFVKNSIVAGSSNKVIDSTSSNGTFNPADFFSSNNNRSFAATTDLLLYSAFDVNNPNFLPAPGSPALTGAGTPPNDSFFDNTATYVGAFGAIDWTFGWARFNPDSTTTGVDEHKFTNSVPTDYQLSQNYPNPFNPSTKIRYSIPNSGVVRLTIFNILGQEVTTIVNEYKNAGTYELNWDASNLPSGMYIYRLQSESFVTSKKMILLK